MKRITLYKPATRLNSELDHLFNGGPRYLAVPDEAHFDIEERVNDHGFVTGFEVIASQGGFTKHDSLEEAKDYRMILIQKYRAAGWELCHKKAMELSLLDAECDRIMNGYMKPISMRVMGVAV